MEFQQFKSNTFINMLAFTQYLPKPLFLGSIDGYESEEGDDDEGVEIIPLDEELNQVVLNLEEEEDHEELPNGFSKISDSEMDDYSPEEK
ncbi:MAG: hypothetical protein AB8G05_28215 [Oligoflexales bacterium]